MSKEKQTASELLKDLRLEHPLASEKELERLFAAASRGNKEMEAEIFEWFVRTEYPLLAAKMKN
jgi:hypothetical protein